MSVEALQNTDFPKSNIDSQERQEVAIDQETDRLYHIADSFNVDQMRSLVDNLATDNPEVQREFKMFQDGVSHSTEVMLWREVESIYSSSENPLDYFWNWENLELVQQELESIWLDLSVLLTWYKTFIESNLALLPWEVKDKVKLAILKRLLDVWEIVSELKEESTSEEDFMNSKWIANSRIQDKLWFVTNELLPSLEAYLKIQSWVEIPEKYNNEYLDQIHLRRNWNYVDVDHKMSEIEELLQAEINEKWEFDEWFLYTQSILDFTNEANANLLADLWVWELEVSLLNDKDKKIEDEATLYFMAMIWVQIWVETAWWVAWSIIWWWVDLVDSFSNEEQLLNIVQWLDLANKDYKMDKIWLDKVLAWMWILPWMTQIIKWSSLAKYLKNIPGERFDKAIDAVKGVLWMKKISKFSPEELEKLLDAESILWRKLEDLEKSAIIEAHNIWERWENWKYSIWLLKEKVEVLKKWWITDSEEIRRLFDNNICWSEYPKFERLYNDPRYSFLEKYKDVIWENISEADIIWEWQNAIIFIYKENPEYVLKISKDKKWVDNIYIEFNNHEIFYSKFKELESNWKISWDVVIPRIREVDNISSEKAFLIKKIDWETLYSDTVKRFLERKWIILDEWLTDRQIDKLVKGKYRQYESDINEEVYSDFAKILWLEYYDNILWLKYYLKRDYDNEILNTLRLIMKETWLFHDDLHSWNIMIGKDWKIYIIDFGRVKNLNK